jgi:type III secretory pathway component EscR
MTENTENDLFIFESEAEVSSKELAVSEWKNMPEFVQEKQEPYAKIIVRFGSAEALQEFSEMIGQKLTNKTKSIWHPQLVRGLNASKRYI